MSARLTSSAEDSLLLQLLRYAGWRLEIRNGDAFSIQAARNGVEVRGSGTTFAEAMGKVFARAMRSGPPAAGAGE